MKSIPVNAELLIKLKRDSLRVPVVIYRDDEGLFIGEDRFARSEFDYDEEQERLTSKDGRIQVQL